MNKHEQKLREDLGLRPGQLIDTNIGLVDILGVNETHVELGTLAGGKRWAVTHDKFKEHMKETKHNKMSKTVVLAYEDIVNITENMSKEFEHTTGITQGYLEYLLCKAIKKVKDVNMFL